MLRNLQAFLRFEFWTTFFYQTHKVSMTSKLKEKAVKAYEIFVNKYEVVGKIGEGSYGIVKRAKEKSNPNAQHVAIKHFKLRQNRDGEGIPVTILREINVTTHFFC